MTHSQISKLNLPELNVQYALFKNEEDGEIDDSRHFASLCNVSIKTMLQKRCIITLQLMSYLFHGSAAEGWKSGNVGDITTYPYVGIIMQTDEETTDDKGHAFFLFKDGNTTYKVESYYYKDKNSTAYIEEFKELPKIDDGYYFTICAPDKMVKPDIEGRLNDIYRWIENNKDKMDDEHRQLLE
jgi:hypothetical protein